MYPYRPIRQLFNLNLFQTVARAVFGMTSLCFIFIFRGRKILIIKNIVWPFLITINERIMFFDNKNIIFNRFFLDEPYVTSRVHLNFFLMIFFYLVGVWRWSRSQQSLQDGTVTVAYKSIRNCIYIMMSAYDVLEVVHKR